MRAQKQFGFRNSRYRKGLLFRLAALVLFLGAQEQVKAGTLWYNGDADGSRGFYNQNNAQFHQILYNDFNVTGNGWVVNSVWSNDIFYNGLPAATNATWEIRSNMPTGTLLASGDNPATLTATGVSFPSFLGYTEYQVLVSGLDVSLGAGTYWLAVYPDDTSGGLATNQATSGANAIGTPPGNNFNLYASTDGGSSFFGPVALDTSAGVGGSVITPPTPTPEPSTLVMSSILLGMLGAGWSCRRLTMSRVAV